FEVTDDESNEVIDQPQGNANQDDEHHDSPSALQGQERKPPGQQFRQGVVAEPAVDEDLHRPGIQEAQASLRQLEQHHDGHRPLVAGPPRSSADRARHPRRGTKTSPRVSRDRPPGPVWTGGTPLLAPRGPTRTSAGALRRAIAPTRSSVPAPASRPSRKGLRP